MHWGAAEPLRAIDVYLDPTLPLEGSAALLEGIAASPPYLRILIERARGTDRWAAVMAKAQDLGPAAPWFRDELERALERPSDCGKALDHLWSLDPEAAARWSTEALARPQRGDRGTCSARHVRRAVDARCLDLVARPELRSVLMPMVPLLRGELDDLWPATESELLCATLIEAGTPTHGPAPVP